MLRKGASQLMWFVLAFVIILILIAIGILIINQSQGYAMSGIDDIIKNVGEMMP